MTTRARRRSLWLVASAVPLLTGCENILCGEGVVSDVATGAPLADVQCSVLPQSGRFRGQVYSGPEYGPDQALTDSEGRYRVCRLVGCVPTCPDYVEVRFARDGYVTRKVKDPTDVALTATPVQE